MVGTTDVATELTADSLAAAMWLALAADYNDAGTMGNKLNTASSGGVDMDALAQAILAAAQITPIHTDIRRVLGDPVGGDGTEANPWGPQ